MYFGLSLLFDIQLGEFYQIVKEKLIPTLHEFHQGEDGRGRGEQGEQVEGKHFQTSSMGPSIS
jgi:hypothetical protein